MKLKNLSEEGPHMWPNRLPFLFFAFFIVSSIENFNRFCEFWVDIIADMPSNMSLYNLKMAHSTQSLNIS